MNTDIDAAYFAMFGGPEPTLASAFKNFVVQCDTFRCLAYRDQNGKWRGVYDNRELHSVKDIISIVD